MGMFVYFIVPLICTVFLRHFVRTPTGTLLLEGLYAFLPQQSAIPAPPPGAKTTKRDRKLLQKRQLQLKGAQSSLIMQQLSPSALRNLASEPSTFAGNFETLGLLLLVLFVGVAVHFIFGPLLGLWQDVLIYTLGPLVALWATGQLILLECGGAITRLTGDRFRVVMTAVLGTVAAYGLLLVAPAGLFRWDVRRIAAEFDALFNGGMARLIAVRLRQYTAPVPLVSDPTTVAAVLAVLAGVMAAALLFPCARIAKLYHFLSPTPHWAAQHLEPHPVARGLIRTALVLPLAVVLYGIVPMSEAWGLTAAQLAVVGPALVAAAAATQLMAVRPLAGAHLGSGLLEWHLLRHETGGAGAAGGAGGVGGGGGVKEVLMRKRLTFVYATVCQVALQLLAPAAILTALALLYGGASGVLDPLRPPTPLLIDLGPRMTPSPPQTPLLTSPSTTIPRHTHADSNTLLDGLEGLSEGAAGPGGVTAASGEGGIWELPPLPPLDFIASLAQFLSWWVCAVICLVTYPLLAVYRTGLHVG